jgi:hypothetical protein
MRDSLPSASSLLFAVGLATSVGLQALFAQGALAQDAKAESSAAAAPIPSSASTAPRTSTAPRIRVSSTARVTAAGQYSPAKRYFVEFRARSANSYGHMYVMYGEVNDRHEIIRSQIAGLFPTGDKQHCLDCSATNWTVGHVVPVPSEIGASDGDLEEQYVLARFRVWIDAAQYKRLVEYIKKRKANKLPWHAFLNNCVTFGRDVAVFLNVNVPFLIAATPSVVMYPEALVNMIREANGVEKEQGPLKDAPGSLPAEVAAELAPKVQPEEGSQPAAQKTAPATSAQSAGRKVVSSTIH